MFHRLLASAPLQSRTRLSLWATSEVESQLRGSVTGIQLVSSPVNFGMAGAGNRGRALARGELLILLHDDVEIEAGWMEALVETADAHPEAGAIGGKALFPDGRLQSEGAILWRTGQVSLTWVGEALSFNRLRAVDVCGTSSLLVRAALWDLVGGLDEQFYPVYYVEVDLGMAIREHGFIVLYQPNYVFVITRARAPIITTSNFSSFIEIDFCSSRSGARRWTIRSPSRAIRRPLLNAPWRELKSSPNNAAAGAMSSPKI